MNTEQSTIKDFSALGNQDLPQVYRLLPRQVIRYWIEGRFADPANRTPRYNKLGWTLLLRGFYWYRVDECDGQGAASKFNHAGFCVIDLDDADVYLGGIRLVSRYDGDTYTFDPFIWRSTILRLTAKSDEAILEFVYGTIGREKLKSPDGWDKLLGDCEESFKSGAGKQAPTEKLFANHHIRLAKWMNEKLNEVWNSNQQPDTGHAWGLVHGKITLTAREPFRIFANYQKISDKDTSPAKTIEFCRLNPYLI